MLTSRRSPLNREANGSPRTGTIRASPAFDGVIRWKSDNAGPEALLSPSALALNERAWNGGGLPRWVPEGQLVKVVSQKAPIPGQQPISVLERVGANQEIGQYPALV